MHAKPQDDFDVIQDQLEAELSEAANGHQTGATGIAAGCEHDEDALDDNPVGEPPRSREEQVVKALKAMQDERLLFLNTGSMPHDKLFLEIENVIVAFAQDPEKPWPQTNWLTLEQIVRVCEEIERRGPSWQSPTEHFSNGFWNDLGRAAEAAPLILDPPAPPKPRHVKLESLETLDKQGVGDANICRIFDWETPDGRPDLERLRASREEGGEEPPTHKTYKPKQVGPRRQPSMGVVDRLADQFAKQRELIEA